MRPSITMLALLLAACAAEPMQTVNPARGLRVDCDGRWGWEACFRTASAMCGRAGFDVLAKTDDQSADNGLRAALGVLLDDPSVIELPGRGPDLRRSIQVACKPAAPPAGCAKWHTLPAQRRHGAAQHKESEMPEPHSPAYMRALAEAGDDEDAGKRLAVAEVLWREAKGDVPEMLVLMAEIAAMLSAAFGPDAADTFRQAFDSAVPIAKRCIGTSVADQPAGTA